MTKTTKAKLRMAKASVPAPNYHVCDLDHAALWQELHDKGITAPTRCPDCGVLLEDPNPKVWALFVSNTAHGVSGIELHLTKRDALESAAEFYDVDITEWDDDAAYQTIEESAGSESWYLAEVEIP